MSPIVADGLGLMVFGMGTVFTFLVVLIIATTIMSSLINKFFPEPVLVPKKPANKPGQGVDPQLLKVLSAAVKEHKARRK
ncbi:OadG family protein [Bermanella sp. R86510]|uniref:OadG family protein n=1 Tax=unclassified Bermanella TaxID=2627862 RepID=UPI0037C73AF3